MPNDRGRGRRRPTYGSGRSTSSTYARVLVDPDHPLAPPSARASGKRGYVLEHRLRAYEAGLLTDLADHVHHVDEDKSNNDPANLEALPPSDHHRHHASGPIENQYGVFERVEGPCSVPGCESDARSRGLCVAHYARLQRYGAPTALSPRELERQRLEELVPEAVRRFQAGEHHTHVADDLELPRAFLRRRLRELGHALPPGRPPAR